MDFSFALVFFFGVSGVSMVNCALSPSAVQAAKRFMSDLYSPLSSNIHGCCSSQFLYALKDYNVMAPIELTNWSKFPLRFESVWVLGGELYLLPQDIQPGRRETMMPSRYDQGGRPSSGSVRWSVEGVDANNQFCLMWFVHNQDENDLRPNRLGFGLASDQYNDLTNGSALYTMLNEGVPTTEFGFIRRDYGREEYGGYGEMSSIVYNGDKISIEGIMGNAKQAETKITVRPTNDEDLAPAILEAMKTGTGSHSSPNHAASTMAGGGANYVNSGRTFVLFSLCLALYQIM